jgi:enterochelin esterase-like enzyme
MFAMKRGLAAAGAGLIALSLVLTRGPLVGHAVEPESVTDGTPLAQSLPQPVYGPGDEPADRTAPIAAAPVAPVPVPPAVSRIVTGTFYSQAMQAQRAFDVYLPPSYDRASDRSYPVLYLLHGDGGRITDWAAFGLQSKMDQAIAAGAPEMIVVMPDGSARSGDWTDWANRWDGTEPVEDQVVELVSFVDHSYRTMSDRSTRFIGGLSSGGFGALNISLHHPDLFSTAMSFSGFIAANDPEADAGVFGEDQAYIERNSPATLVATPGAARDIYYVLSGGQSDPYFQQRMAEFSAELDRLGIAHEFHVVPGGHDGTAWDAGLDFGLNYLAAQIRAATPPAPRTSE